MDPGENMSGHEVTIASLRRATSSLSLVGACLLFVGCVYGPGLGRVSDVQITGITEYQYDDPKFLPCKDFKPSVRDVTRFLNKAIIVLPDDADTGEPCEVSGTARIDGIQAVWRLNMFGIGGATTYSPYQYYALAVGGERGIRRARSRLQALFGPDYFNPRPQEKISLDASLRNRANTAGLPELKDGEVRIWRSSVQLQGMSLRDGELIEHLFSYRVSPANEKHGQTVWVRWRLPQESIEAIRTAVADIVDLNEKELDCAQMLDGVTVQIEAMVNGTRIIVQAQDPDELTSDGCRRVLVVERLFLDAARAQRAAAPAR